MSRFFMPQGRAQWEDYWRRTPGLPIVAVCADEDCWRGFVRVNPDHPDPRCPTCGAPIVTLPEPILRPAKGSDPP